MCWINTVSIESENESSTNFKNQVIERSECMNDDETLGWFSSKGEYNERGIRKEEKTFPYEAAGTKLRRHYS